MPFMSPNHIRTLKETPSADPTKDTCWSHHFLIHHHTPERTGTIPVHAVLCRSIPYLDRTSGTVEEPVAAEAGRSWD